MHNVLIPTVHVSVIYSYCYREKNYHGGTGDNPCGNKTESVCTVEVLHVHSTLEFMIVIPQDKVQACFSDLLKASNRYILPCADL